jgi:hypothetical protein
MKGPVPTGLFITLPYFSTAAGLTMEVLVWARQASMAP